MGSNIRLVFKNEVERQERISKLIYTVIKSVACNNWNVHRDSLGPVIQASRSMRACSRVILRNSGSMLASPLTPLLRLPL